MWHLGILAQCFLLAYKLELANCNFIPPPLCEEDNEVIEQKNLTLGETGLLESPRFQSPLGYDPNVECRFQLKGENGTGRLDIVFDYFDLEHSKKCSNYDHVKIYKRGRGQTTWDQVIGDRTPSDKDGFCGFHENDIERYAVGEEFIIYFRTDNSEHAQGFNLTYRYYLPTDFPVITCIGETGDRSCGRSITRNEESSVALKCDVASTAPTEIKWFKGASFDSEVAARTDIIKLYDDQGNLHLENFELQDTGWYFCRAVNKYGKVYERVYIKIVEKCKCPKEVNIEWYNYPPYTQTVKSFTKKQVPQYGGIFNRIIEDMVVDVCGKCEKGHGPSRVVWNSAVMRQRTLNDLRIRMTEDFDVALPILHDAEAETYRGNYFIPVMNAPGFLLLQKTTSDGGKKVFEALFACWPLLAIAVLMMTVAGIIIWMLEMKWNEDEFPTSARRGIIQGVWWAYITMTTVGYGDIAPRGKLGRVFGVIWIMAGLIIVSILTGAISAGLYVATNIDPTELYGTRIGAIEFTEEFYYAFSRNGKMTHFTSFRPMLEEIKPVGNEGDEIENIIVDTYAAGYYTELWKLRTDRVFSMDDKKYGVVLGGQMNTLEMREAMVEYVEKNIQKVGEALTENVRKVGGPPPFDLMDPGSDMYITSMVTMFAMLVIFSLAGLLFEYGYLRPRQREVMAAKNLDMIESKSVKDMAKSTVIMRDELVQCMTQQMDASVFHLEDLTDLHDKQQQFFQDTKEEYSENSVEMKEFRSQISLKNKREAEV